MSRPPSPAVRGAAVPRRLPAAAPWLLLALTALAALLGSGLATGRALAPPAGPASSAGAADAPLLVVGVVSASPAAVTGGVPVELADTPEAVPPAPAVGGADSAAAPEGRLDPPVLGGSGRAPPSTTGT